MGKYDAIRGAGNVTVQAPPDFWTAAKQSFDDDYDRLVAAQERKKEEERYVKESTKEQNRYDTEQENLMFQQRQSSAENEYSKAMEEYKLAYEQIGKHNPEMMEKLQKQFGKEYKIPRQDGTFETRYVVPQSVREFTSSKVQSRKDLDDILDNWDTLSPSQKTAVWPKVKEINRYFTRDLSDYESSAKKAMSHEDNAKLLDTMGAFLPAGYDNEKWKSATELLLKDGEVSESELKLVAADISQHITNRTDARKFWTNFSSDIMKARGALKLDSDPTTIRDLQGLSDIALGKLDEWYGISGQGGEGGTGIIDESEYNKKANEISQRLYGKNANDIDESQVPKLQEEIEKELSQTIQSGFVSPPKEEKPKKTKKKLHEVRRAGYASRTGPSIEDPVTKSFGPPAGMGTRVKNSPFTYANKGIIPSDEWPGFKEVSIKEALQHYQKNKSKYKKDKKITVSQGLFRDRKDLTQYPK